MVKFPGITGPLKSPDHIPEQNANNTPSPESYKLPEHCGKKTHRAQGNELDALFGIPGKSSPELKTKIGEIAILALAISSKKYFPG